MRRGRGFILLGVLCGILAALSADAGHEPGAGGYVGFSAEHAKRLLDAGARLIFIDLRAAEEFGQGRLPGARSVPLQELNRRYAEVPRTGHVILYCACPTEMVEAAHRFLRGQGYRNLSVMEDGFAGWVRQGYPLER
jgi:rhodanese-related sulfurtransferase